MGWQVYRICLPLAIGGAIFRFSCTSGFSWLSSSTSGGGGIRLRPHLVTLRPAISRPGGDSMARTKVPRAHDPVRFLSNEAKAQYARYERKKVEGGRCVNLASLTLFNMEGAFGDMGWLPVITYEACTRPALVKQFYCNLQLADLLGISNDGPLVYCAPKEPQFLSLEMRAEIDSQLIRDDRWEMKAINLRLEPRPIYLPYIIIRTMLRATLPGHDDERNALVRPRTRVEVADAAAAAAAAGAGVHGGDAGDDDHMFMDVDSIPPPSPLHSTGAG
ncbi:hypothetical protein NE237_016738 [Protea cynaroides]|uniref:Uncharacterized protein n=1 Tax=Protea cynaroides TaxID=273540 RepID=A0A9Q0HFD2_9MAGN|nr:hypothetical protein NE237_016738 [Protea cynaroides]